MTQQARVVLGDARRALDELTTTESLEVWRRRWVTVVALLRAVGHVLRNVDRASSTAMGAAVDAAWQKLQRSKPRPEIFYSFIEEERNIVLKEYRVRGRHIQGLGVISLSLPTQSGGQITVRSQEPTDLSLHVIHDGPFDGRQHADVAKEAIDWWEQYLDDVDRRASASSKGNSPA